MAVFIFPIDVIKLISGQLDAGIVEKKVKALGIKPKNDDHTYREAKNGVYKLTGNTEVREDDPIIVVDPDLGFTPDDIPDWWSFGNGITIGAITLKDGRTVPCGWIVVDHAEKDKIKKVKDKLKRIFMGSE